MRFEKKDRNEAIALSGNRVGLVISSPSRGNALAVVDAQDYELVAPYRWSAMPCRKTVYASSWYRDDRGIRRTLRLHRLVLDVWASTIKVDHRDHDGLNNTRANLRACTLAQNNRSRRQQQNNSSGFKGVFLRPSGRYRASIRMDGHLSHLGTFATPEEAALAYDAAAAELHGEYAVTNASLGLL